MSFWSYVFPMCLLRKTIFSYSSMLYFDSLKEFCLCNVDTRRRNIYIYFIRNKSSSIVDTNLHEKQIQFNIELKIINLNYLFLMQYFTKRNNFMVSRILTFMTLVIIFLLICIYLIRREKKVRRLSEMVPTFYRGSQANRIKYI